MGETNSLTKILSYRFFIPIWCLKRPQTWWVTRKQLRVKIFLKGQGPMPLSILQTPHSYWYSVFSSLVRFHSLSANCWLLNSCVSFANTHKHISSKFNFNGIIFVSNSKCASNYLIFSLDLRVSSNGIQFFTSIFLCESVRCYIYRVVCNQIWFSRNHNANAMNATLTSITHYMRLCIRQLKFLHWNLVSGQTEINIQSVN